MQPVPNMEIVMSRDLYACLKHTSPAGNQAVAYHLMSNTLHNELSKCVFVVKSRAAKKQIEHRPTGMI